MGKHTKYVVIAMNHSLGFSYALHHELPKDTIIVTRTEEVEPKLGGFDMDQLGVFVANDKRGGEDTRAIFSKLLEVCTRH